MTVVTLRVNGEDVRADIPPRTHLADFLREQRLLTGTHLGCEHGVCGACTLLIDDAPARGCIAFAAACDGASVTTIEGLEHDPVMAALRAAFTAEHALQCGYCTPGMLVTARDIVLRLPGADAARIRLELAGNLCRCTGYAGIVRAIQRVLAERPAGLLQSAASAGLSHLRNFSLSAPGGGEGRERWGIPEGDECPEASSATFGPRDPPHPPVAPQRAPPSPPANAGGEGFPAQIEQRLRLTLPADVVWRALQDPALVAGCIPGASVTSIEGNRVAGTMEAALGPIRARFAGTAVVAYSDDRTGTIEGEGQDRGAATRLGGTARFAVAPDGDAASTLDLAIGYTLRGPLAQFARGPVVQDFAAEVARLFGANLEATLQGRAVAPAARLGLFGLLWRMLRRRLGRLAGGNPGQ